MNTVQDQRGKNKSFLPRASSVSDSTSRPARGSLRVSNSSDRTNSRQVFAPEAIEAVRTAVHLEDIVAERISLRPSGKVFVGSCPWHKSKSGRSFVVYPDQQSWRCWGCAIGGDVFSFFMRWGDMSFPTAVKLVAKMVGVELDGNPSEEVDERLSARTELGQVERQITEILDAEYLRVARDLDRANRLQVRAARRLEELSTGGAGRFAEEAEVCWSALELTAAILPRLDAEYTLLAFGQSAEREVFAMADADGRKAIIDELLDEGYVSGDRDYRWEVPLQ